MKYLVETLGDYGLIDIFNGQSISGIRPSVVSMSPFIDDHKGTKIKIIEVLDDAADDASLNGAADIDAAIAVLPRPQKDPLDHDGDGRKGGSVRKKKAE